MDIYAKYYDAKGVKIKPGVWMGFNVVDVLMEVRAEASKADFVILVGELKGLVCTTVVLFLFDAVKTEINVTIIM